MKNSKNVNSQHTLHKINSSIFCVKKVDNPLPKLLTMSMELFSSSPMVSPQKSGPGQDELRFSPDREYAFHGEVLMFVFIIGLLVFFTILVLLPCLKHWTRKTSLENQDCPPPSPTFFTKDPEFVCSTALSSEKQPS